MNSPLPCPLSLRHFLVQVDELSDSQGEVIDVLQLSGVARQAVKLFKGMDIRIEGGQVQMCALTKVPFLKVRPLTAFLTHRGPR
jgi:hypothetical protein